MPAGPSTPPRKARSQNDATGILKVMPAESSPSPSDASDDIVSRTWDELENFADDLNRLARSGVDRRTFYSAALEGCLAATGARGGAVWMRENDEPMRAIYAVGLAEMPFGRAGTAAQSHERLLSEAATSSDPLFVHPADRDGDQQLARRSEAILACCRVVSAGPQAGRGAVAIVELFLSADCSPSMLRGYEHLLAAVSQVAGDYHAFRELGWQRQTSQNQQELLAFSRRISGHRELSATAYQIANEGRRVAGCDRLSVVSMASGGPRLLAISGVSRMQRRWQSTREMERLGQLVARWNQPLDYAEHAEEADFPEELTADLSRFLDASHSRRVIAVPMRRPQPAAEDAPTSTDRETVGVLIAEQFDADATPFLRERVTQIAEQAGPVLTQALDTHRMPPLAALATLVRSKWLGGHTLLRSTIAALLVAAVAAALVGLPRDFLVSAEGRLRPTVERHVFAPASGVVDEIKVAHGQLVDEGQPLLVLDDPELELEARRVAGQLQTLEQRLDAIRATRSDRAIREGRASDAYQLSSEQRQIEAQLVSLKRQRDILRLQREALVVRSPLAGQILTWDVDELLQARPVERGELLLSVADLAAPWQLRMEVPDRRIGHVLAEQKRAAAPLTVRFRTAGDPETTYFARVANIGLLADRAREAMADESPAPVVIVDADLDTLEIRGLRPGMSAQARIDCGRRALGYVWLHEVWENLHLWFVF